MYMASKVCCHNVPHASCSSAEKVKDPTKHPLNGGISITSFQALLASLLLTTWETFTIHCFHSCAQYSSLFSVFFLLLFFPFSEDCNLKFLLVSTEVKWATWDDDGLARSTSKP